MFSFFASSDSPVAAGHSVSRPRDVNLRLQQTLQQRGQLRQQKRLLEEERSRISDTVTTHDQQTDDRHGKIGEKDRVTFHEKKEQAEKPKESRTQPVLPKLILPKPSMIASVAASRGQSSLSATVSRPALKTGEMSPSVLLLSPPASTHPQPMLYLSPQKQNVLTSQQPIVMTQATMGQHMSSWPVNSAPLAFGPVIVSSVAQQANRIASAVTSTAGTSFSQPQHQQLQQLLQQPPQLSRRQPLTTTRVLPRSDQVLPLFTTSVTTPVRTNVSSVCHHQVTVRAPVSSSAGNHSTNVAANPCLAALIRASPSRNSIRPQLRDSQCVNGPLTFKGGLHLHADLAPGGVHLHTDLAPGGSTVSGAFIEGHVSQNDAPSGTRLLTSDNLQDTAVASASISAMLSGVYGTVASPQHSVMQAESCISSLSPASNTPPQKSAAKSSSSGKVLKPPAKTVSTLLKEQRGYGPQEDQRAPYIKDKRPVSELLKESRIKCQLNTYKPRLVMLDTTQTGDGKLTSATAELIDSSNVQFGNDSLARHEPEPVNLKSDILVNDSLRQSGWCTSSSGATSNMIQYLLRKANESHQSWSSSSNDSSSVDMPAMEKDNLLSCLSLAAPDLADITPFINNNDESCNIQSTGVTTAPEGQVIPLQMASYASKLQPQLPVRSNRDSQLSAVGHHMQLDPLAQYQMKAMYSTQSQGDMQQTMSQQQQRNSAVSFSDCLAATYNNAQSDANTRRPQSESSIEQYRQQQDDLSHLALPPVTMTSRPGSDLHGSLADTSFQPGETQSFMNLPLKCGVVRSHVAVNTVDHVPNSNMSFTATHERNPSASMMLSPQSTISHGSPSSTPLSTLSPKTHHRESTITGCQSFTPISGGVNFESRSFVSPVRPMATMGTVAHEHGCFSVAGDPEKAPLKQIVNSEFDGSRGFLPYAATSSASGAELSQMFPWLSDNVVATVPVLPYPQEQPYGLPQTYNNDGHFAPVSSIRPVKRGRCGNNTTPAGLTKRARHHSAQSSFNVDVSNTPTEGSSRINVGAQNFATRRQLPVNSAAFSPEIQHIMDADSTLSTSQHQCQMAGAYSMHRSRSVPAHHMVHDEEDGSCEFSTTAPPDRSGSSGLDELSNEEITQLLQDKMEGLPSMARGLHVPPTQEYAARKNLTELLEGGSSQQEQQAYSSCRGDHMISGASWRPATLTCGDSAKQRFRRAMSYPGEDAALTPPSSQNPTPVDFASVVTTTDQQQSRPCSRQDGITGGRTFVVATAMHTPSSMDVSGDGREPLDDPLFSEVYDDDSSTTRGTADSVLPAGQLVSDHQPMSLEWGLV